MKRILSVLWLTLLSAASVYAQDQSYRVVFDLTSRDSLDQKAVMRWVREISTANPLAQLEVVMYAKGFELVMPEKSTFIADVKEAMKNPNVSFKFQIRGIPTLLLFKGGEVVESVVGLAHKDDLKKVIDKHIE